MAPRAEHDTPPLASRLPDLDASTAGRRNGELWFLSLDLGFDDFLGGDA